MKVRAIVKKVENSKADTLFFFWGGATSPPPPHPVGLITPISVGLNVQKPIRLLNFRPP